jgi:hypothetical protein
VPIASPSNDYAVHTCKCHLLGFLAHDLACHSHPIRASPKHVDAVWHSRERVHGIDKQTSCNLPHISMMHTSRFRSTQTNARRMPKKVPPVDRHGGSSAAWNSLDYHQLISWLSFPTSCYRLNSGRERRLRSSIRPMKFRPRLGSIGGFLQSRKMCRLFEGASQPASQEPCFFFFAMIFRLLKCNSRNNVIIYPRNVVASFAGWRGRVDKWNLGRASCFCLSLLNIEMTGGNDGVGLQGCGQRR